MNKKKLFGVLAAASMILSGSPLSVMAEEMTETTPGGITTGVPSANVALNSTNFPDANLLNAIKKDNQTATTAGDVEVLNVPNSVQSLEGLQYLTNLKSFSMTENNFIQEVDLSNATNLNGGVTLSNGDPIPSINVAFSSQAQGYTAPIVITGNGVLTSIILPDDEDLKAVIISGNKSLDQIDLSPCALLEYVDVSSNSLDELSLTKNVYIQNLNASGNDLYQFDTTPCKQLQGLNVNSNSLYELKIPTAVPNGIQALYASRNKLLNFDVSGLSKLKVLNMSSNMLQSIKLPNNTFDTLRLDGNHLASLNLSKVNFSDGADIAVNNQILYANATDKAINVKEYDANFDPSKATLSDDKPFDEDGVFDLVDLPGVGTLTEMNNNNTVVTITVGDPTTVVVTVNGKPVAEGDYSLSANGTSLTAATLAGMSTKAEVEALGKITVTPVVGSNYSGTAKVEPIIVEEEVDPAKNLTTGTLKVTVNSTQVPESARVMNLEDEEVTGTIEITNDDFSMPYNPTGARPTVEKVEFTPADSTDDSIELTVNQDYTVEYGENTTVGENKGTITIEGAGDYKGEQTVEFTIAPASITAENLTTATQAKLGAALAANTSFSVIFKAPEITIDGESVGEVEATLSAVTVTATTTKSGQSSNTEEIELEKDNNDSKGLTWKVPASTVSGWDSSVAPANVKIKSASLVLSGTNIEETTLSLSTNQALTPDFANVVEDIEAETAFLETSVGGITGSASYYTYDTGEVYPAATANANKPIDMTVYVVKEDLMNRLYNPNSGEHFYTKNTHEKDVLVGLGWQYEGTGWVAPIESTEPVYRLYNPNAGDHHYTKDVNEKDTLVRVGWNYEGIGWYSAKESSNTVVVNPSISVSGLEVFREYNPNAKEAGAHNYTISEVENNTLVSLGWLDEGLAWRGLK